MVRSRIFEFISQLFSMAKFNADIQSFLNYWKQGTGLFSVINNESLIDLCILPSDT